MKHNRTDNINPAATAGTIMSIHWSEDNYNNTINFYSALFLTKFNGFTTKK